MLKPVNDFHAKRTLAGFTLLELSMVLLIMSIILGAGINLLAIRTEAARVEETKHKMEVIQQALAEYLAEYRRLPCPALASIPVNFTGVPATNLAFGEEYLLAPGSCGVTSVSNNDPNNGTMGTVPTRTLQIDDDYQFDGWNRHIDYNVNQLCTSALYSYMTPYKYDYSSGATPNMLQNPLPATNGVTGTTTVNQLANFNYDTAASGCVGLYTINDAAENIKTTAAIVVLVSHGKDGHGAYNYAGTTRINAANSDADKDKNAHMDGSGNPMPNNGVFIQKSPVYTSTTPYKNFDDIVSYVTKDQLLANAGVLKGMAGNVVAPAMIDPVCNLIDKKLGAQPPAVVTYPNPPLLTSAEAICGTGTTTAGMCAITFLDLAQQLFFYCY